MTDAAPAPLRLAPLALVVTACLAFVAIRAPMLSLPLERDEGEYAYIAQRMLAGEVPYRDVFDQKPPGVFLSYLLAFALLGPSVEAIHLFLHLWAAVAAVVLFGIVRALAGSLAAGFSVLVFAVASADPQLQGHAANTENWMLLPLVLAAGACVRGWRGGGRLAWLACGACSALACWFKQVAVTDALLLAAAVRGDAILGRATPDARESGVRLVWFALGAALVSAPVLLYFAANQAFSDFADAVFLHNLAYAQAPSAGEALADLRKALGRQAPSFGLVWALAIAGWAIPGSAPARVRHALGAWWIASLAGAAIGLRFRPHYFLQAVPALSALAGLGAARLCEHLASRRLAPRGLVASALAALLAIAPLAVHRRLLLAGSPAEISRAIYGLNPFPESLAIAEHIRSRSRPDERVFIVGSEPQILFHAGRRSATRYIFFYPLTGDYPDADERQQEVIDEVAAAAPRYVVWADVPTSLLRTPASRSRVFDATVAMLRRSYELELIARIDPSTRSYRIDRGEDARDWVRALATNGLGGLPSVAVYRRVR